MAKGRKGGADVKAKQERAAERETARMGRDIKKTLVEGVSIVDEDMRDREFSVKKKIVSVSEVAERPQSEYRGVGMFYRKFVSKLKNALK